MMMQQVKQEQADLDEDRDDNDDEDDDEDVIGNLTISTMKKGDGTFGDDGMALTDLTVQDQK
jgi:hypothetical protein